VARGQRSNNSRFSQEPGQAIIRVALYARVSTLNNQDPEMQLRELREYAGRSDLSSIRKLAFGICTTCRIEASPHGFLILCRTVWPSLHEVYDGEAPSSIEKARHHSLKASAVERTKQFGRLFGVGLPSELRLFAHREAYAFFCKMPGCSRFAAQFQP
jgi:hypothetical protein